MSSSDAMQPAPWALDELPLEDLFAPVPAPGPSDAMPAERDAADAAFDAAVEARVAARLAALRPQLEEAAYARGRADGVQQTGEGAREQVARLAQAFGEATQSLHDHEQRWLLNVEENLAAIAVTVARHLIHRELTSAPSVITDLVQRALRQFPLERQLTVRLHPDDHAIVQEALESGGLDATTSREIRWHPDAHIVRGGCLVEGRERVLDGRIDTALERAYRALGQVQA